jgi:hypothetical protein
VGERGVVVVVGGSVYRLARGYCWPIASGSGWPRLVAGTLAGAPTGMLHGVVPSGFMPPARGERSGQ